LRRGSRRRQGRRATGEGDHDARRGRLGGSLGEGPRREAAQLRRKLMNLDISDTDPALAAAVLELETHSSEQGWDRPATLSALVDTKALAAQEPALAALMGLDDASAAGSFTPVEQEQLTRPLEEVLPTISWPGEVVGCAAVVERLVLPPGTD